MKIKTEVSINKVKNDAEDLFRGGFFCSEAVISSIRSNFYRISCRKSSWNSS